MTAIEARHGDWLWLAVAEKAPDAIEFMRHAGAWREVATAFYRWHLSRERALRSEGVSAGHLFGFSRGAGRRSTGGQGDIEILEKEIARVEKVVAAAADEFEWGENSWVTEFADQAASGLREAINGMAKAKAALALLRDELEASGAIAGPGSLADKQRVKFESVALVAAFEWKRCGIVLPTGNDRRGGFIDLLDAIHQAAGAGPLKSIPTLMANIRQKMENQRGC